MDVERVDEAALRLAVPQRTGQAVVWHLTEDALPPEHPARVLWTAFGQLDLASFLAPIKARVGTRGRPATHPRVLLTLWSYALTQGVTSAHHLAQLPPRDVTYRWIVGDLAVSHDTLSAFLARHHDALDALLTDVVARLYAHGRLDLATVGQDGTRVRASAAAGSFRTPEGLAAAHDQATLHLRAMLAQAQDARVPARQRAARVAGARATLARVEAAQRVARARGRRAARGRDKRRATRAPKASPTDPAAAPMRMGDGGTRPAYNWQFVVAGRATGGPRTILAVRVTHQANDRGSLTPVRRQVARRLGRGPAAVVADADHLTRADLRAADADGVTLLLPPKRPPGPHARGDALTTALHARMADPATARRARVRASLCELANAHTKVRFRLDRVHVRGPQKVRAVALLAAITFNVTQHRRHFIPPKPA